MYAAITNKKLLQSFCALSFPAVNAWAALDELAVHTENVVAVLLTLWRGGEVGQECKKDELAELGQVLRVGNLTPLFRRLMLPHFDWFAEHVAKMNIFAAISENMGAVVTADVMADSEYPDAWSAKARQGILPPGASDRATMTLQVPETELREMLKENASRAYTSSKNGCSTYWFGYFWSANISLKYGKLGGGIESISRGPLPAAPCIKYTCKVNETLYTPFFLHKHGVRFDLFSDLSPITSLAQLKPHISDGRLEVRFELSDIS